VACLVFKYRANALGQTVTSDLNGRLLSQTTPAGQYKQRASRYLGDPSVGLNQGLFFVICRPPLD
jgi:hypothetical protein